MSSRPLRILNLGAGVQSTTVALMAIHGELPQIDCAIFADTHWEPASVYDHVDWLSGVFRASGIDFYRVSAGSIRNDMIRCGNGERWASPPVFTKLNGSVGQLRRQCTREYKIDPINRKIRELLGLRPRQHWPKEHAIDQWFGISTDEIERMRISDRPAIRNVYPLIEMERMNRWDCLQWLRRHGYKVPSKSACIGCPYHKDALWRDMRDNHPDEWADACAIDETIRHGRPRGIDGDLYLHRSGKPLAEADLSTLEDEGQARLFIEECEGMCGV